MSEIRLVGVSKIWGSTRAVDDVTVTAPARRLLVLLGPSGCGKSTTLRLVAGLERATAGRIWIGERDVTDLAPAARRLSMVFQSYALFPHLTVRENILFGLKVRHVPREERERRLARAVDLLGIGALLERRPSQLSGGQQQRIALARAVVFEPRLLLMDEPLGSLDLARKEEMLLFIERLPGALGIPILYVSHAIDEVLRLASTLVLIDGGRIVATGPLSEVAANVDLRPFTGLFDEGAVVRARVERHDPAQGLTILGFSGGELVIPSLDVAPGTAVNALIRSRDVALSLRPPEGTSILNVLRGRVVEIREEAGPQVLVRLDVGCALRARIMRKSIGDLQLSAGKEVYALVKAVAVDQRTLGRPTAMDRSPSGRRGLTPR